MLRDGALEDATGAPRGVLRLRSLGGALWAATGAGAYRFQGGAWERIDERPFTDFCVHLGQVHGATRDDLFRFEGGRFVNLRPPGGYLSSDSTLVMEDSSQVLPDPVEIGPVARIASYSGTLYMLRPDGLALLCRLGDAAEILVRNPEAGDGAISALAWDKTGARLLFGTDAGRAGLLTLPA